MIKQLSDEVIKKIAAGQVIESPFSVVKELLENSLDAKATEIIVELVEGGFDNITFYDNGIGMDQKDLLKCFLFHTTSKIETEEDLFTLKSFGFRGEALHSICLVSDVSISSVPKEEAFGSEVVITKGTLEIVKPYGGRKGTLIQVSNLFENIPVRKKFKNNSKKEVQQILELITSYALIFPNVSFSLSHNGKNIFQSPSMPNLGDRISDVLGASFISQCLQINSNERSFNFQMFVSKPQFCSLSKTHQYLFVNDRLVKSETISKAIKDAYGKLIEDRMYPPFLILLKIDSNLIDVNVHPKKEVINFWNNDVLYSAFHDSVKHSLSEENLDYSADAGYYPTANSHLFSTLKDSGHWDPRVVSLDSDEILQVFNTYLIYSEKNDLVVIDQHAAHESVLFEEFSEKFSAKSSSREQHKFEDPLVLDLSSVRIKVLEENLEVLENLGFEIALFGKGTVKVTSSPSLFQKHDLNILLCELLDELRTGGKVSKLDSQTKRTLEFLACRSAVKSGDPLALDQRQNLVKKLSESKQYLTCPHGRPTKIILTRRELDKMFRRLK
jgi:DNA mismatch repair protein MutL